MNSSPFVPKIVQAAVSHLGLQEAMVEEMVALESNHSWTLVPFLPRNLQLVVDGSSLSKWVMMVRLIG